MPPPGLSIRPARPEDHEAIGRVGAGLGYDAPPQAGAARLEGVLAQPDHAVMVAEEGGEIVGWVHVFAARRVASEAFAELGGLVVSDEARRGGVGRALVEAATAWGRAQGLDTVRVRVNEAREGARAFYRRIGFRVAKTQEVLEAGTIRQDRVS